MRLSAAAVAVCLTVPTAALAQDATVPRNAVSLNALGVVVDYLRGTGLPFELEYERALGERFSVYVAPRFTWISNELATGFGGGLSAGGRYYALRGPALAGLWIGADVGSDFRTETANGTDAAVSGFDGVLLRALVGYNLLLGPLYLSPGMGVEYRWPELPRYHLRLSVGYAF